MPLIFSPRRLAAVLGLIFSLACVPLVASFQPEADDPDLPPPEIEVQASGPVHEAFAQPNEITPEIGHPIPKEPPPPLPELPPEERPEDDRMDWIPGYWAWDSDREEFVWVSGVFRDGPPGRRFVPGYWSQTSEGWRWIPGFWAPETQQELQYVPEPPAPLDQGPSIPAPDDNCTYVPGYWVYSEPRYLWRPGYWAPHRPGRLWVSARYLWTPGGYLFNDGYWDYPLEDRGVLFAPVAFSRPLWADPLWSYRPRYVVSLGLLTDSFFYRPGGFHFYFGNYYGHRHHNAGYRPWWNARHDPLFDYYRWHHRNNPNWAAAQHRQYDDRVAGRQPLPPRTYSQQRAALKNPAGKQGNQLRMVSSLKTPGAAAGPRTKFVPNNQVATQKASIDRTRELASIRAAAAKAPAKAGPRVTMPGTPPNVALKTPPQGSIKLPPATPRVGAAGQTPRAGSLPAVQGKGPPLPPAKFTAPPSAGRSPVGAPPRPQASAGAPKGGAPFVPPAPSVQPRPSVTPPSADRTLPNLKAPVRTAPPATTFKPQAPSTPPALRSLPPSRPLPSTPQVTPRPPQIPPATVPTPRLTPPITPRVQGPPSSPIPRTIPQPAPLRSLPPPSPAPRAPQMQPRIQTPPPAAPRPSFTPSPPRSLPSAPRAMPSPPRAMPSPPRAMPSPPRAMPSPPRAMPSAPRGMPSAPRMAPSAPRSAGPAAGGFNRPAPAARPPARGGRP